MLLCMLLFAVGAGGFYYVQGLTREYEMEKKMLSDLLCESRRVVYFAALDLMRGDVIGQDNTYEMEIFTNEPADWFMTEQEFGKTLRMELKKGTPLYSAMLEECITEQHREVFIDAVRVDEFMEQGDRIDVRIRYRTGEDYTVLADKELLLFNSSGIVLSLQTEEINLLSSAMADEKSYAGTVLYAVRYPKTGQTAVSRVTYLPNLAVQGQMQYESAAAEYRKSLEKRIKEAGENR